MTMLFINNYYFYNFFPVPFWVLTSCVVGLYRCFISLWPSI